MAIKMLPVRSSNVDEIGYDAKERRLWIRFLDGSLYRYEDVPQSIWRSFKIAPSKGRFVWQNVRDRYEYERVE